MKEIELQSNYLDGAEINTIYFGGGTPSLIGSDDLFQLLNKIRELFTIIENPEITLEANPDDITPIALDEWKRVGINRLSIGVQSFFDEDLNWMNRAHNAHQATGNLQLALTYFENITIDLIYGYPLLTGEKWKSNINKIIKLGVPHISCYALTVETGTPLYKSIRDKKENNISEENQASQFLDLIPLLEAAGYEHYEVSNFAKSGYRSRHNSSYWQGEKYLGIGPSAHSFNKQSRQWNVSNNGRYIEGIMKNSLPFEKEILSPKQVLNEYIMTSLRTMEGLELKRIPDYHKETLMEAGRKYIDTGKLYIKKDRLILSKEGKLFADGIAAELFADQ